MRDLEHVFTIEMDMLTTRMERGDIANAALEFLQKRKGAKL